MARIVITEDVSGAPYDALGAKFGIARDHEAWRSAHALHSAIGRDADVVIVRNRSQVNDELFAACPGIKVIGRAGVGLDNIDVEAADHANVVVVAPIGANATSVAEHTLALALSLAKGLRNVDQATRAGRWIRRPSQELAGKTWGLLSAGATARATAGLARAFGMDVVAHDPFVDRTMPELVGLGIRFVSSEEVFSSSDVVSVHLPLTPETTHAVGARELAMMRRGSLLIGVGRGGVIDEAAVADALEADGGLAGAGLDVREAEPPSVGRLESLPNVILTPHVAGITEQSQDRIARVLCGQIETLLDGGAADPRYAVGRHRSVRSESSKRRVDA